MPSYLCITGGLRLNGKSYKAGSVYSFPKNPAEEHFVFHSETDTTKRTPKFGQEVRLEPPPIVIKPKSKDKKKK
jgi:hypothetical protein